MLAFVPMNTRLLLLSVSAGNGHVRAAQALAATAQALSPPCQVTHIDAMAHVAEGFRKLYTEWYVKLVNRAPDVWSYLHHRADATPHSAVSQRLRRAIERLSAGALLRALALPEHLSTAALLDVLGTLTTREELVEECNKIVANRE